MTLANTCFLQASSSSSTNKVIIHILHKPQGCCVNKQYMWMAYMWTYMYIYVYIYVYTYIQIHTYLFTSIYTDPSLYKQGFM